jgi:hypothetical protein
MSCICILRLGCNEIDVGKLARLKGKIVGFDIFFYYEI